jgi:hypothetical protein
MKKMKNILILIITMFSAFSYAQNVRWIPSSETDTGCAMQTDCKTNTLCYSLEYTPETSGILTSYTTGFFADCKYKKAHVIYNQSCTIEDNSRVIDACTTYGKMLLNCSGNTGNISVETDQPIILHQVCFDMDTKDEVNLELDPITGVTVSIDISTSKFTTSYPKYETYSISTRNVDSPCDPEAESSFELDSGEGLIVFPNPSTGLVKFFFEDGGSEAQLTITSSLNQSLATKKIECGKEYKMDLTHFNPGTYIAHVKGENSTLSSKFILIK